MHGTTFPTAALLIEVGVNDTSGLTESQPTGAEDRIPGQREEIGKEIERQRERERQRQRETETKVCVRGVERKVMGPQECFSLTQGRVLVPQSVR
jgi:hypothetical protein